MSALQRIGSLLRWAWIGAALSVLLGVLLAVDVASAAHYAPHGHVEPGAFHGFGGRGGFAPSEGAYAETASAASRGFGPAAVSIFVTVMIAAAGALIWAKSSGLLRWAGAALAAIAILRLLPAIMIAASALLLAILIYFLVRKRKVATIPQPVDVLPYARSTVDPAAWLDEWERKQRRD